MYTTDLCAVRVADIKAFLFFYLTARIKFFIRIIHSHFLSQVLDGKWKRERK